MKLVLFCLFLIFLTACADNAIRTAPFNGTTQENTTVNVTTGCEQCNTGETCKNNQCVCAGKTCEGVCIAANECCTSAECGSGTCVRHQCKAPITCAFNEEFREGECLCVSGYSRCQEQNKCIKVGACCHSGNCARGERCVPTIWRTSVCFQLQGKKTCRLLADNNRSELVTINDIDYRFNVLTWSNNGNITLAINNQTLQLANNQSIPFASNALLQEGINEIGGTCKEDEDT